MVSKHALQAAIPVGVMKLGYEPLHILQDVLFLFTGAVWCLPSLALAHAHSSSGGVETHAQLSAPLNH